MGRPSTMFRCLVWLACPLVCAGGLAQEQKSGTTYYVASTGSDLAPGTLSQPFQSVARALKGIKPGDTVIFRSGTHAPFSVNTVKGTPEAWITFKAEPGERVTIDAYLGTPANTVAGIYVGGQSSYLVFDGLEVISSHPLIDQLRPLNMIDPKDLDGFLSHLQEPGLHKSGVRLSSSHTAPLHHLTFKNMDVHHLMGLGFSGGGDDLQFLNNHVHDLGRPRSGYGWYSGGLRHLYRGNIVHDNIYGFHLFSQNGEGLRDSILENNLVYNNGLTPYYHMSSKKIHGAGVGILISPGRNNTVRNNIVVNNSVGISISCVDSRILHNTVYNNQRSGIVSKAPDAIIQNNILFKNKSGDDTFKGNWCSDPLFIDPDGLDFHLRAESPAVASGTPSPDVKADYDGNLRPQKSAPDMGACEHVPTPPKK